MAEDGHGEFPLGTAKGSFQPLPLLSVHGAKHAGVHCDQTESLRMQLEERPSLMARADTEFTSQPRRLSSQFVDSPVRGDRQSLVGLHARAHASARSVRFEEIGSERFQSIVPVVITRYRV